MTFKGFGTPSDWAPPPERGPVAPADPLAQEREFYRGLLDDWKEERELHSEPEGSLLRVAGKVIVACVATRENITSDRVADLTGLEIEGVAACLANGKNGGIIDGEPPALSATYLNDLAGEHPSIALTLGSLALAGLVHMNELPPEKT